MRPLLAIILAVTILLGVHAFLRARTDSDVTAGQTPEPGAEGAFEIAVTLTFDVGPDPFALETQGAPSVIVAYHGQPILKRTESVPAGTILRQAVAGVVEGRNEFYVQAVPQQPDTEAVRAVRLQVLKDGALLAEEWLASEPGAPVEGPVMVEVPTK